MTPSLRTGKKGVCRACAKGHSYRSNCSHRKLPPPPFEDVSGKSLLETSGALSFILRFHIDTRLGIGSARCEWVSSLGLQRLRRCVNSLRAWKVWQQPPGSRLGGDARLLNMFRSCNTSRITSFNSTSHTVCFLLPWGQLALSPQRLFHGAGDRNHNYALFGALFVS